MSRPKPPSKADADKTKAELQAELVTLRLKLHELENDVVCSGSSVDRGALLDELAELKRNEALLDGILDTAGDVIISIDEEQHITRFNRGAQQTFGYRPDEVIGQPLEVLLPEQHREAHRKHVRNFRAGSSDGRMMNERADIVGRRRDGTNFPARASISRVEQDGEIALTVFLHDISDIRDTERLVQRSRNELAHVARIGLMGEISASLAHELNQPLAAILTNAQVLRRQIDAGPGNLAAAEEASTDLIDDARRAGEVVRRLRALLKPGERKFELLQLNDVVADVRNILASEIIIRQVTVEEDLAPDLPMVSGDRIQLQQTLLNFFANAFDSFEQEKPADRRVRVRTSRPRSDSVELCVTDTGSGFARGDYKRLFEPFQTTKRDGMGMGLAICRTIINEHSGRLWAENNPDRGASFYFSLPIASSVASVSQAIGLQCETAAPPTGGTVFIVDDDPSVRKALGRLALSAGYATETFATAQEFLRREPYGGIGCMVVDHHMPGESGLDLQEKLSLRGYSMPIIFITGSGSASCGIQAMKQGALDVLAKPVDDVLLLKAIEHALEVDTVARKRYERRKDAEEKYRRLSPREAEIMELVVKGYRNKQIAYELGISEKTVKVHRGKVMEKFEAKSLAHLVRVSEIIAGDAR